MVLQELGQKIKDALNKLNKSDNIDQKLLKEMLTTLSIALIKSDVKTLELAWRDILKQLSL